MKTYPAKLIVLFPMYETRDYRRHLAAVDDALVVHRRADGAFLLELRPMVKLKPRGPSSYAAALITLAADLEAGHTVVIVDRDQFLADLEALARKHAGDKDREEVERAAQVVADRTLFQIKAHDYSGNPQYHIGRMVVGSRQRKTRAEPNSPNGLNVMCGIPTPRSEQLWHVLRHELTNPRDEQAGRAAWEQWCRRNRPAMPRPTG